MEIKGGNPGRFSIFASGPVDKIGKTIPTAKVVRYARKSRTFDGGPGGDRPCVPSEGSVRTGKFTEEAGEQSASRLSQGPMRTSGTSTEPVAPDGETAAIPGCRACGSKRLLPDRAFAPVRLLGCAGCGSLSLDASPNLAAIQKAHGFGTYHGGGRRKFGPLLERGVELFRRHRADALVRRLRPGDRVVDVGCGRARMAAEIERRGFDVIATEISAEASAEAQAVPGLDVRVGPDALGTVEPGSARAVTFFHTLEHMPDPVAMLVLARKSLRPDGFVLLEVPLLSPLARAFGAAWFHLDPPRHLVHFSEPGLRAAARAAGFEVARAWRFSLEFSGPSLFLSLCGWLAPWARLYARIQGGGGAGATAVFAAGALACTLPAAALGCLGQGDVLRVLLEPRGLPAGSR